MSEVINTYDIYPQKTPNIIGVWIRTFLKYKILSNLIKKINSYSLKL